MADDAEFRAALVAFLRLLVRPEWLAERGEEDFQQLVDVTKNGTLGRMFRTFRAEHGRYPEYEELCPPGGPTIGIVPDIR